jgi:hypothetical protein
VTSLGRALWIEAAAEPIRGGMSGSPIIAPDGKAIGIVSVSASLAIEMTVARAAPRSLPHICRDAGPAPDEEQRRVLEMVK